MLQIDLGRIILATALTLVHSCATSPIPGGLKTSCKKRSEKKSKSIRIAYDRWHSGIILPRADVEGRLNMKLRHDKGENKGFVEFGWGDGQFYQSVEPSFWDGLGALFWPTDAVIAVRTRTTRELEGTQAIKLTDACYKNVFDFIRSSLRYDHHGPIKTKKKQQVPDMIFFEAQGSFHMFYTCNSWTAMALQKAGMKVDPRRISTVADLKNQVNDPQVKKGRFNWP